MLEHQLKDFHQYVIRVRKKTLSSARGPKSNLEHEGIMVAIRDKDGDLAEKLAHEHIINAYENLIKSGFTK